MALRYQFNQNKELASFRLHVSNCSATLPNHVLIFSLISNQEVKVMVHYGNFLNLLFISAKPPQEEKQKKKKHIFDQKDKCKWRLCMKRGPNTEERDLVQIPEVLFQVAK